MYTLTMRVHDGAEELVGYYETPYDAAAAIDEDRRKFDDEPEYSAYVNPLYEWRENGDPGELLGSTWECTYCHMNFHKQTSWNPRDASWHYCPNCGKRMGKQNDDQ